MNFDTLAESYLLRDGDEHFRAWEEVHRMVKTGLNGGWKITLLLLERAISDNDIEYIAAGPLEDLIDIHGHKALDLIEEECKSNSRLQLALSTAGVLFYYDEFDRWYALLCKYGFKEAPSGDSRAVIEQVMQLMHSYLNEIISVDQYDQSTYELLQKPLDEKAAQRTLQKARLDLERSMTCMDGVCRSKNEPELKELVRRSFADLESLGYRASC
jgi:hypothetical protein